MNTSPPPSAGQPLLRIQNLSVSLPASADLRVASQVCDSIVVMHKGRVVESGPVADVYARPAHAYTQALLAAVPGRQWGRENDARSAAAPGATP